MSSTKRDRTETDSAPDSTWGASTEAKSDWQSRFDKAKDKVTPKSGKNDQTNEDDTED